MPCRFPTDADKACTLREPARPWAFWGAWKTSRSWLFELRALFSSPDRLFRQSFHRTVSRGRSGQLMIFQLPHEPSPKNNDFCKRDLQFRIRILCGLPRRMNLGTGQRILRLSEWLSVTQNQQSSCVRNHQVIHLTDLCDNLYSILSCQYIKNTYLAVIEEQDINRLPAFGHG